MAKPVDCSHPGSFYAWEQKIADNPGNYWNIDIRIEYDGRPANAGSVTRLGDVNPVDRVPTKFVVKWVEKDGATQRRPFVNRN